MESPMEERLYCCTPTGICCTAMSNYFLSYTQIIGPWSMTNAKLKPCSGSTAV
jgi:hypothetical protein